MKLIFSVVKETKKFKMTYELIGGGNLLFIRRKLIVFNGKNTFFENELLIDRRRKLTLHYKELFIGL
jgi:hypothetical protein